jgi:hypothetical protein
MLVVKSEIYFGQKTEGKKLLGKPRHKGVDNIKIYIFN